MGELMPAINEDTADFWKDMVTQHAAARPDVGKAVRVTCGREHKGKAGQVIRHMRDRYSNAFRYGSEAFHHMQDIRGKYGFVCQVEIGTERFWVRADYVEVIE